MRHRVESRIVFGDNKYVTMAWLRSSADASGAQALSAAAATAAAALAAPPRAGHHSSSSWLARARRGGAASWQALAAAAALGANAALLIYLARRAYLGYLEAAAAKRADEEQQAEITRVALAYLQRLWDVSMASAAGAPPDLGPPDEEGVYTYEGRGGAKLYFRAIQQPDPPRRTSASASASTGGGNGGGGGGGSAGGGGGGGAPVVWQWSTSKRLWLPTSAADSIWCDSGDTGASPCLGGRLLIRRMELESQLAAGAAAARCSAARSAAEPLRALPPLDLPHLCQRPRGGAGAGDDGGAPGGANGKGAAGGGAGAHAGGGGAGAAGGNGANGGANGGANSGGANVPDSFICPLSQHVMTDPVVTPGGVTYDRAALEDWLERHGTDPVTGHPLSARDCYPNLNLRDQICGHFLVRDSDSWSDC